MSKIRRILINFARAERVVALSQIVRSDCVVKRTMRASRSLRSQTKTKNFLTNPFSAGGVGGAAKKMKGNFLVLFPPLHSSKKDLYLYFSIVVIFRPSFSPSFASGEARPVSAFGGSLRARSHFAITSHWPLTFVRDACSVLASCSLCGFVRVRGNSKKADCAKLTNGTSKSYCACPNPPVRAQAKLPLL
jgi:hypothetical protein